MDIAPKRSPASCLILKCRRVTCGFIKIALFLWRQARQFCVAGRVEKHDRMKKSIVISITKGRLFPSLEDCHNIFEVRDRKRGLLLCDRLELHFLELSKIDDQKPVHALTEIERLGAYLKFANIENRQDYVKQILTMEDIDMTENAYRKVTEDGSGRTQRS